MKTKLQLSTDWDEAFDELYLLFRNCRHRVRSWNCCQITHRRRLRHAIRSTDSRCTEEVFSDSISNWN